MYTQRMDRFINSIQIRNRCRPDQNESPRVKKNGQLVEWTCYYRWCIVKPFLWIVLCHTHNFPSFFCICRLCWASVRMLYYCVPNQLRQNRKFWLWLTFIVWSAREKKERERERGRMMGGDRMIGRKWCNACHCGLCQWTKQKASWS